MAKKSFTLDDALFQKKIRDMAKSLKIDEKEFVRQQGGLFLADVAKFTPPFASFPKKGGVKVANKNDLKAGITSIRKDLSVNFRVRDQSYIDHIYDVTGKTQNIRQVLRNRAGKQYVVDIDFLNMGSFSEALRFHRSRQSRATGRAFQRRKGGKDTRIGRWKDRNVMWVNQDIYNRLHDYLIKDLGKGKGAVMKAAIQIDPSRSKGLIAWVRRHANQGGQGRMAKIRNSWNAVFNIKASALYHVKQPRINMLKMDRLIKMNSQLKRMLKHNAKKSGFKVK